MSFRITLQIRLELLTVIAIRNRHPERRLDGVGGRCAPGCIGLWRKLRGGCAGRGGF
jgi:hypothetical protein